MKEKENVYEQLRYRLEDIIEFWQDETREEDVKDFKESLVSCVNNVMSFKLYHYVPADFYNIRNIERGRIHLSNNGLFNDVYEGIGKSNYMSLQEKQKQVLGRMANICCFTENYNHNLMWSHYADFHKGMCIEYDLKRLETSHRVFKMFYPVLYDNHRFETCNISDLANDLIQLEYDIKNNAAHDDEYIRYILPFLLRKDIVWEYEKEWRIIYTLADYYDDFCEEDWGNYVVDFDCISAVYCGARCEKEFVENLKEIQTRKHESFDLFKMNINDSNYTLDCLMI